MEKYVLYFNEIDKTYLPYVGGKGANLGEMTKAGFPVPQGFCVTTLAYKNFIEKSEMMNDFFDKLENINSEDLEQIAILGQSIREHLSTIAMPEDMKTEVLKAWKSTGKDNAYAVRSSATAEDLPTASFAGQQDTYLNILGQHQLIIAIQNCWASLFTDRAISYRAKNKFDHRQVFLSVVVQQMVFPEVSGIMFTADPVTGNRKTISIDASFGLGEALVSGIVTADLYQVQSGIIIKKQISKKKLAIYSVLEGGTKTEEIPLSKQEQQALTDENIIKLSDLGRKIEAHYGSEQDIEWALADGKIYILQSRPITSLYPLVKRNDNDFHVYMSFGHIQMMTDAMKPLALSLLSNISNFITKELVPEGGGFIYPAGGRAYPDVTAVLLFKPAWKIYFKIVSGMDELIASAMTEVANRDELKKMKLVKSDVFKVIKRILPIVFTVFIRVNKIIYFKDTAKTRAYFDLLTKEAVCKNENYIFSVSGAERIRRIKQNVGELLPLLLLDFGVFPITGVISLSRLEKIIKKEFDNERGAYLLGQLNKSLPGNITTEIGLELGILSDCARKYPEVVEYLKKANDDESFFEELIKVDGGKYFIIEMKDFLNKYGARCIGEIDITKTRWNEKPTLIIPFIINNIRTTEKGEQIQKFKQGEVEAEKARQEIISHFSTSKRKKVSKLIYIYRNLMGLREHHKFVLVLIFDIYKRAILQEAEILVKKGTIQKSEDIFYFTFEEIINLLENDFLSDIQKIVLQRENQYLLYQNLVPPRVMTSDGEIITGKLRNVNMPSGALVGTPVSAGIVEGVARVILRLEDAKLNPGEILVAPYTDPGWTPLFTSAIGLVTEVGGMMTHGSVVAREYGIPAVVGIDNVTKIIKDGDKIRVDGIKGYVQIL